MNGTSWYIVFAVVTVAAAVAVRMATGRPPRTKLAVPTDAAEIAYLSGGHALATLSALAALRADGLVTGLDGRLVQATGEVEADRDPLQKAVHAVAAGKPVRLYSLSARRTVAAELALVTRRVAATGLLAAPEPPRAARRAWLVPAAAALLGVVGLVAGFPADPGIVALVLVLLGMAAAVLALVPARRARTRAADAALAQLRREHPHLAPSMNPSWRTYGAAGAALAVALYGEAALQMAEPAFARAILTGPLADARPRRTRLALGRSHRANDGAWAAFGGFDGSGWTGHHGSHGCGGGSSCGGGGGCGG